MSDLALLLECKNIKFRDVVTKSVSHQLVQYISTVFNFTFQRLAISFLFTNFLQRIILQKMKKLHLLNFLNYIYHSLAINGGADPVCIFSFSLQKTWGMFTKISFLRGFCTKIRLPFILIGLRCCSLQVADFFLPWI